MISNNKKYDPTALIIAQHTFKTQTKHNHMATLNVNRAFLVVKNVLTFQRAKKKYRWTVKQQQSCCNAISSNANKQMLKIILQQLITNVVQQLLTFSFKYRFIITLICSFKRTKTHIHTNLCTPFFVASQ